jgi:carbonic anhydrase
MPLKLLKGIRHFKNNAFLENKNLFSTLTSGQHPDILFITCSDSRIIPSAITHAEYGDLFVIRNAGNIIPPYSRDPSGEAATIEYAIKKLNIKEIIVCGHSQCGAMQGLMEPQSGEHLPAVSSWLTYAQPALQRVQEKQPEIASNPHLKLVHTTQENILLQIENLKTHPAVKEKLENKQLLLHGWFYDIKSGEIYIYTNNKFIPFEDAVTELFNSNWTYNKMRLIVEEEALKYLGNLIAPETAELYKQTKSLLDQIALNGVSPIWVYIHKSVRLRLWSEFGELCEDLKGCVDQRFTDLLESAQNVKFSSLKGLHRELTNSPGYHQFCSQAIRASQPRQANATPFPEGGMEFHLMAKL